MKRLLLVDDDAVVMRTYRDRLSAHGFQVNTAASGTAAIAFLRAAKPDVVVLDLMMPDLSGVDVLKFIRSQPRLATTPVVVLTNAYLNDLGRQAATIGIEKAFLKADCSPQVLMAGIDEILENQPPPGEPAPESDGTATSRSAAAPGPTPTPPPAESKTPSGPRVQRAETPPTAQPSRPEPPAAAASRKAEPRSDAARVLLGRAPTICADLRKHFQGLSRAPRNGPEQQAQLQAFYREVHSLSAAAGQTEYPRLTQTAAVFEALLFVLIGDPAGFSPSVVRTLANLVDYVERLFRNAGESGPAAPLSTQVLLVDDDQVSNHVAVAALRQAQLNPRSTEDPLVAWQWMHQEHFDLVVLDIEMPGLDGFQLCERLRRVPGYEKTPVIFVTIHSDFENRAKSTLSGGDDLIAKPILPMELAAKVVMHLLKSQTPR
jgi:DNA-binding response OmpR family regulator